MVTYEETQKLIAYMNEFDSFEIEAPRRFIYAFKWLAKILYGEESCTDVLFIEMVRNTADKFGIQVPKLAEIKYEMNELDRRADEYYRKEKEKNR